MNWLLFVLGIAVVLVVMWDALITTLAVASSSGPISGPLAHWMSEGARRFFGPRGLQSVGILLTLVLLSLWLVLLWAGWSLIFNGGTGAVVDGTTGDPAGFWDRVYFAGSTMFTLGPGEFHPEGAFWQVAAVVALLNGLGLASLGITYLIPLTAAATERRQLAATIASLGERPDEALIAAWDGESFGFLPHHLITLGPEMDLLSQRHLAYPVLHFFRSGERKNAAAPMIARLDEMLTLLRCGLADPTAMPRSVTEPLHASLTQFMDTLHSAFIDPEDTPPAPPPLDRLREAGIATVDDATFNRRIAEQADRRRLLLALVHADAWEWDDVWLPAGPDTHVRENPLVDDHDGRS